MFSFGRRSNDLELMNDTRYAYYGIVMTIVRNVIWYV